MKKISIFSVLFLTAFHILASSDVTPRLAEWSDVTDNMVPRSEADVPSYATPEGIKMMKALRAFESAAYRSPGAPASLYDELYPAQVSIAKHDFAAAGEVLDEFAAKYAGLSVHTTDGRAFPIYVWIQLVKRGFIPS